MRTAFLLFGLTLLTAFLSSRYISEKHRIFSPSEVPTAMWAWRNSAPSTAEVEHALSATNGSVLFLHLGQIDYAGGQIQRIRPVTGEIPQTREIHAVYNGTRRFLGEWESVDAGSIAAAITATFAADQDRANRDGAKLSGVQLDLDIPTRLLPKYSEVIEALRRRLPSETKLSITGLATWVASVDLPKLLAKVDFWIPQCYGRSIPVRLNEKIPIASAADVERTVDSARKLNSPFYAGLAAYGYAILYSRTGELLDIRGDIDPAAAARASFEKAETRQFDDGESQIIYRANDDVVLDGMVINKGESVLFDVPSATALRSAARIVREQAGDKLLGICIFRLPQTDDPTALTINEVAAALTDTETSAATSAGLEIGRHGEMRLSVQNDGSTRTAAADAAFTVDVRLATGEIAAVSDLASFDSFDTLCQTQNMPAPVSCSPRRANVLRLYARDWGPGSKAWATIELTHGLRGPIPLEITSRINDGRVLRENLSINRQHGN